MQVRTAPPESALKRRSPDPRVNLSSNELLHPEIDVLLAEALRGLEPRTVCRYPVTAALIADLAGWVGLDPAELMLTPGSDSALRLVCQHYADSRAGAGQVLLQYPNYEAWELAAARCRLPVTRIAAPDGDRQGELLLAAAGAHTGALIAVSVPNGPIGWSLPDGLLDALTELAERRDHLLVIDACYQAFAGAWTAQLARRGPRVVVVQSLSKSHGLAGGRIGLLATAPGRIQDLAGSWLEQCVAAPTLRLAHALIGQPDRWAGIWADVGQARTAAVARLRELGTEPLPSGGNFVTFPVGSARAARDTVERLSRAGYRVRDLGGWPEFTGYLRMTVGHPAVTGPILDALTECARLDRAGGAATGRSDR